MEDITKYPVIIDGEKYEVSLEDEGLDNFANHCVRVSFSKIKAGGILDLKYECIISAVSIDSYVDLIKDAAAEFVYQKQKDQEKNKKEAKLRQELDEWNGVVNL